MIKIIIAIVVLGAGATGAWWFLRGAGTDDAIPTYVVGESDLVRQVNAEGNLRAVKKTPLTVPKTSGEWGGMKLAWVTTDGTHVKKGDVVVKFDRTDPEKKLVDGQADLASADARLAAEQIKSKTAIEGRDRDAQLARTELDARKKFQATDTEIFSRNQIIESQIDDTLATAKQDHAEKTKQVERTLSRTKANLIVVEQQKAKIAITHAKSALESMEIRAPHDGIFVLQRNWRGEVPKIGDQMWPSQTVAEIPLLEAMEAEVFVLEVDGSGLAEKQLVEIVIEAKPDTVYTGKIKLVDKLAKPRVGGVPIQYFAVTVSLDKTDVAYMKPGQRVRGKLIIDKTHGLVVPRQAILNKDGKSFVYKRSEGGEFEQVPVELGAATSGRVAVKTGLTAGDVIALRDPTRSLEQTLGSGTETQPPPSSAGGGGGGETIMIFE